jgi:hypothetical protein
VESEIAIGCTGIAFGGTGLHASRLADKCSAYTASVDPALYCEGNASYCSARNGLTGPAIQCLVSIGCSSSGGDIIAPQGKFLQAP